MANSSIPLISVTFTLDDNHNLQYEEPEDKF